MKNYHPICNLPFISKLIEKVVARDIEEHLEHNDLNDSYHNISLLIVETAPLKVHTEITGALDEGSMTALFMLDLSAAFEIIDHPIQLRHLEFSF